MVEDRNGRAAERITGVAVLLLTFFYLCLFRRLTRMDLDEGIVLQGAERVLAGQVAYRDFFSFLTPGSVYFYAFLFRIFGNSILVARTALAVMGAGFSWFTYSVSRRVCPRWCALLAAGAVTLTCLPARFVVVHNWDSTFWACGALYAALRWSEDGGAGWAATMGLAAGLTGVFEQSKGVGLVLGLLLGLGLMAWTERAGKRNWRRQGVAAAVGFVAPVAAALAYLASRHALGPFFADMLWPLRHYGAANRVAYGSPDWSAAQWGTMFHAGSWGLRLLFVLATAPGFILPALPILALAVGGAYVLKARGTKPAQTAYYLLLTSAMGGLWLSILVTRQNIMHFTYLAPVFYLILAWMIAGEGWPGGLVPALRPALTAMLVVIFACAGGAYFASGHLDREAVPTHRGMLLAAAPNAMLSYLQAHAAPGTTILVYPYAPMYYFLSGTYSPLRTDFFQPGMYTRAQALAAVDRLRTAPPQVAIFDPGFYEATAAIWPNTPEAALARDPVADFIFARYRFCRALSGGGVNPLFYMVLRGGGSNCPSG